VKRLVFTLRANPHKAGLTSISFLGNFMHEMGIVQSIMDILEQQAKMNRATRIVGVTLEFGALTAVMPEAVRFAFEILSKGGMAEGARLDITIIPIKVLCMDCSKETIMDNYQPFCPKCSSPTIQIIEGRDEMRIVSLEVDGFEE
jgi:hydrogenase nickel incorporation protein HypA/HybF